MPETVQRRRGRRERWPLRFHSQ